jgi:DNA polymerase-3 subunit beta
MEFTCQKTRLQEALSLIGSIVPAKSAKPVLQNIHFNPIEKNLLQLSATDLDVGVKYDVEVENLEGEDMVVLPANRLLNIVRDAWGDSITIKIDNNKAKIITEGAKFDVLGEAADEFPLIPDIDEKNSVEMMADDLAKAINQTAFATAREEERYALAGVNISMENDNIDIVTTDTFRLALSNKKLRTPVEEEKQAIVLVKGMNELNKLLAGEEIVKLNITDTYFFAKTSRATVMSRLIEGKFPNYKNVLPEDLDKCIKVKRDVFMQGLKQAAHMSNEETREVNITAHDSIVELKSNTASGGEADVKIDAEIEGGEVSVSFNYTYITDVIKVLEGDIVKLSLRDKASPGRIDEENYTYVISPISPHN